MSWSARDYCLLERPSSTSSNAGIQHPVDAASTRHTSPSLASESCVTCRLKTSRETVWMLSKFTTHSVGTPSVAGDNSSSESRPRRVRVSAATTTDPMWSATGSRVSTRTGRSPPGVAANQISPRCIGPVVPVLGHTPICDRCQGTLAFIEWLLCPGHGIVFACQAMEVATKGISQQLRTIDSESASPRLRSFRYFVVHAEAQHCHTTSIQRMTLGWSGV
jgi:hypothetical protein